MKVIYLILNFFIKLLIMASIIPNFWRVEAYFLGFLLSFFGYRKKVISKNLTIAFGTKFNLQEQKQFIKKFYYYLGYELCYLFYLLRISKQKFRQLIEIKTSKQIKQLCQTPTPLILLSAHSFGFWTGLLFSSYFRTSFIYTYNSKKEGVSEVYYLFEKIAKRLGSIVLPKGKNDIFKMVTCLKNNHCLNILGDLNTQNTTTFIDFFGKQAAFAEGTFRLALKMKTPIIYGWVEETKNKKLILNLVEIYNPQKETPSIKELIIRYKNNLEAVISKNPYCYLWSNKRWKTRPPADSEQIYN